MARNKKAKCTLKFVIPEIFYRESIELSIIKMDSGGTVPRLKDCRNDGIAIVKVAISNSG